MYAVINHVCDTLCVQQKLLFFWHWQMFTNIFDYSIWDTANICNERKTLVYSSNDICHALYLTLMVKYTLPVYIHFYHVKIGLVRSNTAQAPHCQQSTISVMRYAKCVPLIVTLLSVMNSISIILTIILGTITPSIHIRTYISIYLYFLISRVPTLPNDNQYLLFTILFDYKPYDILVHETTGYMCCELFIYL